MARRRTPPIEPREIARILLRHRRKIVATFLLTLATAVVALIVLPRTYMSQARILVRVGRESVTLDPTASTGTTNPIHKSVEAELQSVRDLLISRAIYEDVVKDLGVEYVLAGPEEKQTASTAGQQTEPSISFDAVKARVRNACIQIGILDEVPLEEKAIRALEKSFDVSAERSSSVIVIACKANTPERAQAIVSSFLKAAREQHVRVNHNQGSHAFFAEQLRLLEEQWNGQTEKLRDLKNEQHLVSVEGERKNLEAQMQQVETARMAAVTQVAAAQALIAGLSQELAALPQNHKSQEVSGFANLASDAMRQELYRLKIQESELLAKFTPEHRQVMDIRERIAEAQRSVESEPALRTQTTEAVHPGKLSLDLQLAQEKARLQSQQSQLKAIQGQQEQLIARIESLNEGERKIDEAQRSVDVLAMNLRRYAENVEQSRIDQALETDRISNINIVQPASLMASPTFPKPLFILAAAFVAAVGGSLSLAFVCEFLDRSLKTSADVSSALQVPVLLTVPRSQRSLPQLH
jgi:uncharacterized protein involved in exopolysaccharide biosynthesis